jgi:tRNA (cytidine/uridine-2'-O-)-methyltransferase
MSAPDQSSPSTDTRDDDSFANAGFHLTNPLLNVVLVEPEIPNNTGNIGRTCVTTGSRLHLVHPLAFDIDEKACRRAGLDYWPRLDLVEHNNVDAYLTRHPPSSDAPPKSWFLTSRATKSIFDVEIGLGDHIVFGRESRGLGKDVIERVPASQRISVPMVPGERSLNLSTCVAVCVYTAIRNMYGSSRLQIDERGRLRIP